jgi:hypothetical protein
VVLDQDIEGFFVPVFANQVARTLWEPAGSVNVRECPRDDVTYKTKIICKIDGKHCNRDGILQAQLPVISAVRKDIAAAIIAPKK